MPMRVGWVDNGYFHNLHLRDGDGGMTLGVEGEGTGPELQTENIHGEANKCGTVVPAGIEGTPTKGHVIENVIDEDSARGSPSFGYQQVYAHNIRREQLPHCEPGRPRVCAEKRV